MVVGHCFAMLAIGASDCDVSAKLTELSIGTMNFQICIFLPETGS